MKVAIYTRVSGKSNRQDAANQSLQLIEYCQRQGWDYIEYTDRMSGTRADRAAFLQMFEDARRFHDSGLNQLLMAVTQVRITGAPTMALFRLVEE